LNEPLALVTCEIESEIGIGDLPFETPKDV
jgi:hypothetical protein